MKLEEAKQILNCLLGRCKKCDEEYCDGCYIDNEDIEAIETKLQEIERLQKENELAKKALIANSYEADERNNLLVKIQELKKENEQLRTEVNSYRIQVNSAFDNGFIHKDKIRDKIEELEKTGCTSYDASTADAYQSQDIGAWNALTDLLKEE